MKETPRDPKHANAVCDAKQHPFFDLVRQKVIFSHKQCKHTAEKSLPFLLYFHVHFAKLTNLVVDYVSSCDAAGRYTPGPIDEALFKLQVDADTRRSLFTCKAERDTPNWFGACAPICEHMSLTKIEPFMLPNVKKLTSISSYILSNWQIIKNQADKGMTPESVLEAKAKNKRMLEEEGWKSERQERALQQTRKRKGYFIEILRSLNYEELETSMIPGSIDQTVNLDEFKPTFRKEGINLYEISESINFNVAGYKKTKKMMFEDLRSKVDQVKDQYDDDDNLIEKEPDFAMRQNSQMGVVSHFQGINIGADRNSGFWISVLLATLFFNRI